MNQNILYLFYEIELLLEQKKYILSNMKESFLISHEYHIMIGLIVANKRSKKADDQPAKGPSGFLTIAPDMSIIIIII